MLDWLFPAWSNLQIIYKGGELRKIALIALTALGWVLSSAVKADSTAASTESPTPEATPATAQTPAPALTQTPVPEYSEKFRRGGSLSLEPAFLIPSGALSKVVSNTLGYNLNFDIGISQDFSMTFGGAYYNQQELANKDAYLMLCPAWAGFKSKNQFLPSAEVYWEVDAALYYEKEYLIQSGSGAIENLDGGGIIGAGFDVWWTRWLLSGFEAREHVVVENGQVFPFMQLGIRVGIKG
jgi:hypothetical protein